MRAADDLPIRMSLGKISDTRGSNILVKPEEMNCNSKQT
jgi:hypothetical protein